MVEDQIYRWRCHGDVSKNGCGDVAGIGGIRCCGGRGPVEEVDFVCRNDAASLFGCAAERHVSHRAPWSVCRDWSDGRLGDIINCSWKPMFFKVCLPKIDAFRGPNCAIRGWAGESSTFTRRKRPDICRVFDIRAMLHQPNP